MLEAALSLEAAQNKPVNHYVNSIKPGALALFIQILAKENPYELNAGSTLTSNFLVLGGSVVCAFDW